MTLCVGQPAALGCCRTLIIVCGFYEAVKYFCAAPMSKKKPAIWRVSLNMFCFIRFLYFLTSNWISEHFASIFIIYWISVSIVVFPIF